MHCQEYRKIMEIKKCKICNQEIGDKSYLVPEMMFGMEEKFIYLECQKCGCLQIKEPLTDLSKYYPVNYYSFHNIISKFDFLISFLRRQMAKYYIFEKNNILGMFLIIFFGIPDFFHWFKKIKLNSQAKILDVGCGIGHLLVGLKRAGFANLTGVDAYIEKDIFYYNKQIKIFKEDVFGLNEKFDFIILNHSFEHMLDPQIVIKKLFNLLNNGGRLLIRVPVVSSYAWQHYGVNWVQLDAPRHVFIPSFKSMEILANVGNFDSMDVVFESWDFQFWGSEQYLRNIPLRSFQSYAENPKKSIFTKSQIKKFKIQSKELNLKGQGDTASFYFYKK